MPVSQVNGLLAIYIIHMSKDGMSKDYKKISPMHVHVTLEADVKTCLNNNPRSACTCILGYR